MESYRQFRSLARQARMQNTQGGNTSSEESLEKKVSEKNFVVGFDGPSDRMNPRNWSLLKRILVTACLANVALVVGVGGASDSAVLVKAAHDFGVSEVAESRA